MLDRDLEIVSLWNEIFREFSCLVELLDTTLPDAVPDPEPVPALAPEPVH
nr:hypothetical protein [uncultured Lichenicoccus sp.]